MKGYFAHPIEDYDTQREIECINLIKQQFPDIEIENPKEYQSILSQMKAEYERMNFLYNIIDKCDIFIYAFTKDNSLGIGVTDELTYTIPTKKRIFKIKFVDNKLQMKEITPESTLERAKNIAKLTDRSNWVLKSLDDYKQWYLNNPEAWELIKSQLMTNSGANIIVVPHYNTIFKTNNFKDIYLTNCREKSHKSFNDKHAFVDTRFQEYQITCPYIDEHLSAPVYYKRNLKTLKDYDAGTLLSGSRTIHRLMATLGNDRNNIVGMIPLFDMDIKRQVKDEGRTFFDEKIFNQYQIVKNTFHKYMDENWTGIDYKFGFSGNGIYVILEEVLFKDLGINWTTFIKKEWKEKRGVLKEILKNNHVTSIVPEEKYGWSRYFKVMGTFHLSKERIAMPLNKDEPLDYEWIDEISKIELGLSQNIYQEIMRKAGNSWR